MSENSHQAYLRVHYLAQFCCRGVILLRIKIKCALLLIKLIMRYTHTASTTLMEGQESLTFVVEEAFL